LKKIGKEEVKLNNQIVIARMRIKGHSNVCARQFNIESNFVFLDAFGNLEKLLTSYGIPYSVLFSFAPSWFTMSCSSSLPLTKFC